MIIYDGNRIAGFLGAGKTTFLQHMIQNKIGMKFGLVVNDMASVNVDSKLIRKQTQGFDGVVRDNYNFLLQHISITTNYVTYVFS